MKVVEASAGALTNFEVLDLLRSRGAGKDASRAIATVSQSEFKVFDYLEGTVACNQTREIIDNFVEECQKFDLAKAEILNIVNIRPRSEPELFPVISVVCCYRFRIHWSAFNPCCVVELPFVLCFLRLFASFSLKSHPHCEIYQCCLSTYVKFCNPSYVKKWWISVTLSSNTR
ncbi:uncharacterized protein LOC130991403 isoform X1 [Salvia miltiorrhiza]|uniref:uncharacterized protein LOC130991403 isoform X1 n=1 Tax=Salvia miltiorrhiza TaxID=226208 RepID=UPI0025AD57BD|nr:uncharacterized protein LOC130991403 isoform X1 [Salvia miltiorrhiza]XP_057771595.1 uncharacterized protein LOC130991403 isoform X1 [Salvia miltiorrhiza]